MLNQTSWVFNRSYISSAFNLRKAPALLINKNQSPDGSEGTEQHSIVKIS